MMRTEILSLYSQPGGSIAVQKSQLVNLTPKEILDMADSAFGQMHTLVACLEVRDGQVQKMQHRSIYTCFIRNCRIRYNPLQTSTNRKQLDMAPNNPQSWLILALAISPCQVLTVGPCEATIEKTENDTEYCQRLCLHHAVDRTLVVMRHFTSSREVSWLTSLSSSFSLPRAG